jgi:HAD superfamily hydrolase (TIGR01457 family)
MVEVGAGEARFNPAEYSAFLFDLDGTLYLGDQPIPGAAETIARLRTAGKRTVFLSNNPTRTREQYAAKLGGFGIRATVDDIITSSFVMVRWLLKDAPGARLFVVGEEPLKSELREEGFEFSEQPGEIDIVIASFDRGFTYEKLQTAFDAVRAGARLVGTNPDRYCPMPNGGGQPDAAAMIAAIEACTGVKCDPIVGKPSPIMVSAALDLLGLPLERCIMVGDRLETDIKMGVDAGIATCLVLTGDATREKLAASEIQPALVLESVAELLAHV